MGVIDLLVQPLGKTNMSNTPKRKPPKPRSDLLAEIAGLPSTAFINTAQAEAYLGACRGVMPNWRSQRRGPRYHGTNDFVRYRISDLDLWMSSRANEVRTRACEDSRKLESAR
jgi:hypothetical protein